MFEHDFAPFVSKPPPYLMSSLHTARGCGYVWKCIEKNVEEEGCVRWRGAGGKVGISAREGTEGCPFVRLGREEAELGGIPAASLPRQRPAVTGGERQQGMIRSNKGHGGY
jgi:hypothetical protein